MSGSRARRTAHADGCAIRRDPAGGELPAQHAGVISRSVEHVARGGADAGLAERILLHEAGERDPRDLLRYGLSLLHRLAPREMESEEERRHRRRFLRMAEVFDGPLAGAER